MAQRLIDAFDNDDTDYIRSVVFKICKFEYPLHYLLVELYKQRDRYKFIRIAKAFGGVLRGDKKWGLTSDAISYFAEKNNIELLDFVFNKFGRCTNLVRSLIHLSDKYDVIDKALMKYDWLKSLTICDILWYVDGIKVYEAKYALHAIKIGFCNHHYTQEHIYGRWTCRCSSNIFYTPRKNIELMIKNGFTFETFRYLQYDSFHYDRPDADIMDLIIPAGFDIRYEIELAEHIVRLKNVKLMYYLLEYGLEMRKKYIARIENRCFHDHLRSLMFNLLKYPNEHSLSIIQKICSTFPKYYNRINLSTLNPSKYSLSIIEYTMMRRKTFEQDEKNNILFNAVIRLVKGDKCQHIIDSMLQQNASLKDRTKDIARSLRSCRNTLLFDIVIKCGVNANELVYKYFDHHLHVIRPITDQSEIIKHVITNSTFDIRNDANDLFEKLYADYVKRDFYSGAKIVENHVKSFIQISFMCGNPYKRAQLDKFDDQSLYDIWDKNMSDNSFTKHAPQK